MKRFEEIKKLHEHFACGHEEIDDLIQMVDLLIKRNSFENGNLKELRILFKDKRILKYKNEGLSRQVDLYRYFPERIKDEIYKLEDFINTFKFIDNTECYVYKVAMEKLNLLKQIYYKY